MRRLPPLAAVLRPPGHPVLVRPHGERFERRDGRAVRIITDVAIQEISIVTFPAYEATDVQVAQRALQLFTGESGGRSVAALRRQLLAR